MAPATFPHQGELFEYVGVVGFLFVGALFPGLFLASLLGLSDTPALIVCWATGGALAWWYVTDLHRLRRERRLTITDDALVFQAYEGDVTTMRWDEITEAGVHSGLGHRNVVYWYLQFDTAGERLVLPRKKVFYAGRGRISYFARTYFTNDEATRTLRDVAQAKLGERFKVHAFR